MRRYGLRKGDVVALFSPNTIWYPVAMLAVNRLAGIVTGVSPAYNVEEMAYALKTAKAKFLMTVPGSMGVAMEAAKQAGIPEDKIFLLEGEVQGFETVKSLIELGKSEGEGGQVEEYRLKEGEENGDLCGFLSFSSGTTGLPKAVSPPFGFPDRLMCCSARIFQVVSSAETLEVERAHTDPPQVMISHQNVIAQCLQIAPITPPTQ